jgi:hypothetical protein
MTRWWKRLVGAILALSLSTPALAAITWVVVTDQDCTGLNAATALGTGAPPCCRAAASAGGNQCNVTQYMGNLRVRYVTFVQGASSAYTSNGDALNTAALQRIGLTNVVFAICSPTQPGSASVTGGGQDVMWQQTAAAGGFGYGASIVLYQTGANGTTPVTSGGQFAGSLANVNFQCRLEGY